MSISQIHEFFYKFTNTSLIHKHFPNCEHFLKFVNYFNPWTFFLIHERGNSIFFESVFCWIQDFFKFMNIFSIRRNCFESVKIFSNLLIFFDLGIFCKIRRHVLNPHIFFQIQFFIILNIFRNCWTIICLKHF